MPTTLPRGGLMGRFAQLRAQQKGYTPRKKKVRTDKWGKPVYETVYDSPEEQMAGGQGPMGNLAAEYGRSQEEARAANEARYEEIRLGHERRIGSARQLLAGAGQQEERDISEAYRKREAGAMQDLTGRGLAGTTARSAVGLGVEREKSSAIGRMRERYRGQQLGIETGLAGERLAFMERREDEYPDLSRLEALVRGYGQAGGAGDAGAGAAGGEVGFGGLRRGKTRYEASPMGFQVGSLGIDPERAAERGLMRGGPYAGRTFAQEMQHRQGQEDTAAARRRKRVQKQEAANRKRKSGLNISVSQPTAWSRGSWGGY